MTSLGGSTSADGSGLIRVPPLSFQAIERVAEAFVNVLSPMCLQMPIPLNVLRLVDDVLPKRRIHFSAASEDEMDGAEGLTNPDGGPDVEVLMSSYQFFALADTGPQGNRARATATHEMGHVILHVPVIRRRRALPHAALLLKRHAPQTLKAYENPEWQAWAFAGCILMPRRTVMMMGDVSPRALAQQFEVSEALATQHLRRLRLTP